ncbi:unnamed protein product [Zymoseptoria tritici ST99CH_3D1]|nr:unnamed protein product [Zymoseptoria tritici ST99CH_3D1]
MAPHADVYAYLNKRNDSTVTAANALKRKASPEAPDASHKIPRTTPTSIASLARPYIDFEDDGDASDDSLTPSEREEYNEMMNRPKPPPQEEYYPRGFRDYDFVHGTPQEAKDRLGVVMTARGPAYGEGNSRMSTEDHGPVCRPQNLDPGQHKQSVSPLHAHPDTLTNQPPPTEDFPRGRTQTREEDKVRAQLRRQQISYAEHIAAARSPSRGLRRERSATIEARCTRLMAGSECNNSKGRDIRGGEDGDADDEGGADDADDEDEDEDEDEEQDEEDIASEEESAPAQQISPRPRTAKEMMEVYRRHQEECQARNNYSWLSPGALMDGEYEMREMKRLRKEHERQAQSRRMSELQRDQMRA